MGSHYWLPWRQGTDGRGRVIPIRAGMTENGQVRIQTDDDEPTILDAREAAKFSGDLRELIKAIGRRHFPSGGA